MLQKYIVVEVSHEKHGYMFQQTFLDYDKTKSSLLLQDAEVKSDIDENICYIYEVLRNMVKAKIYSSLYSAERAVKNNTIKAILNIIYTTDLEKCKPLDKGYNDIKTIDDFNNYCSAVQYEFSLNDNSITRYELYGDPLLGDYIERPISDLMKI